MALDLRQAGLGSRFLAISIDWLVQIALGVALIIPGIALASDNSGLGIALFFIFLFLVILGYPVIMETLWRGRTLGKAAMGLRVVTVDGAPIRFRHAAIRGALGLVDFYLTSGAGAVLSALLTARGQRLGDLVAGTIVLRERTGLAAPAPTQFSVPPDLESYVATLDVSALRAQDYQTVRSYLLRAPALTPEVRYRLAVELADPVLPRLRPPPPPGIHPAWFLICVATAYQRRNAPTATTYGAVNPYGPPPPPPRPLPRPPPSPRPDQSPPATREGGFAPMG